MNRSLSLALVALLTACGGAEPAATERPDPFLHDVPSLEVGTLEEPVQVEEDLYLTPSQASTTVVVDPEPVIASEPAANATTYALRRGETLAHFARWSDRSVEDVAASSSLDLDGVYAVGTEVALVLTPAERSTLEGRRDAHHQARARSYLASRNASRTEFYSVRTGDSAWTIASDGLGMPVWLLESLNPSVDLDRLRPGQELLVPIFEDIVAEAPEPIEVDVEREPADPESVGE